MRKSKQKNVEPINHWKTLLIIYHGSVDVNELTCSQDTPMRNNHSKIYIPRAEKQCHKLLWFIDFKISFGNWFVWFDHVGGIKGKLFSLFSRMNIRAKNLNLKFFPYWNKKITWVKILISAFKWRKAILKRFWIHKYIRGK